MPSPAPKFGRYVVLDELADATGERTLVAYDPQLDRKVGLKLFPAASDGAQARRRARAQALAGIVHPHVVRVHDVGTVDGRPFAAMDFVEGSTLQPWIDETSPPWSRVLEVMLAAGEGLAAAHAAGLVHGRFCADAIVVGDDGQVRVIDFVRSMPQLGASRPDEARDRRDFCATLYRALWQRDPEGDAADDPEQAPEDATGDQAQTDDDEATRPDLTAAERIPADTKVPRRVRRAILDGLQAQPRRASLRAVLDELHGAVRRRRWVGAAALLGLSATAAAAIALQSPPPAPEPVARPWCEGVAERLTTHWNEGVAQRGHAAFAATGVPYAEDAWRSTQEGLDRFAERWRKATAAHCEEGPDEDDAMAHATATVCLHRQLQALGTFAASLPTADAPLVASAAQTVASLGNPASCGADPEDRARYADMDFEQVLAVEALLSQAMVQHDMGHYADGLAVLRRAHAEAETLGARALAAEAEHGLARIHMKLGDEAEAERLYHEGFSDAVASRHDELVARCAMDLAVLLAEQGRHADARRWLEHAAAATERHETLDLRTHLTLTRGLAAFRRGDQAEAKQSYERALELAEMAEPVDDFAKIDATQGLGNVLGRMGDYQEEIAVIQEGLAFIEKRLGPEHPAVGHYENTLAAALARRGSTDLALAAHARALAVFEGTFGPDHRNTIAARIAIASTLHEAGRDEEAERSYDLALDAARRTMGEHDPRRVTVVGNVGMFYAIIGRHDEAVELLSEAATRNEAIHGPDHEHTLGYLNNLAATYMFQGDHDRARPVYVTLIERTGRALGEDHPQLVPALLGLGTLERLDGHAVEAVPLLERALVISIDKGERPERIGSVRFQLAQALWESELDRPRALTVARAASQSYVTARDGGWAIGDRIEDVQQWLREHGG